MAKGIADQLHALAEEGQKLSEQGITAQDDEFNNWYGKCRTYIKGQYDKNSRQYRGFRGSKIENLVMLLKGFAAQEDENETFPKSSGFNLNINQYQYTNIHQQISQQIQLNIEYSGLGKQEREEVKALLSEIETELKEPKTNWDKVKELLKKGFDYGLKVGLPLAQLVGTYYQAKC